MARVIQRALTFTGIQLTNSSQPMMNSVFTRSFKFKEPFSYDLVPYRGHYEKHNQKLYPRSLPAFKEEELLDEIHAIKQMKIENPSPFHVVRRVRSMGPLCWNQKVALRRLNLHSQKNGECMIIPNTPQFNFLLSKVKQVITLKPAKFANGEVPTEDDIGAIKVCPYTGVIRIDEKLRLSQNRLAPEERPMLFRGKMLRFKLGQQGHPYHVEGVVQ